MFSDKRTVFFIVPLATEKESRGNPTDRQPTTNNSRPMKTIYNIALMTERSHQRDLIEWLRAGGLDVLDTVSTPEGPKPVSHFVEVVEVEGDPRYAETALSLALQYDFDDREQARFWGSLAVPRLRESLLARFGEKVMVFGTVLEQRQTL